MPRKRKVPLPSISKTPSNNSENITKSVIQNNQDHNNTSEHFQTMYDIMSNIQLSETYHPKFVKDMQQLYSKMDHESFMHIFINMVKAAMASDVTNEFAHTTLLFCAKFFVSYTGDDTHIILKDIFKWLTETISTNPHIRYRLCQFVNIVLNALGVEAALDDCICDSIMSYMINRLRDINPNVRVQAILALQRLQCPDNPDDVVLKTYQFHLSSDPSPKVRQAVITSMGRNYNTIPYILERLWDIDEKVRKHTYLNMSSYPVKSYKVSQRLMLLEQGLSDRSDMVRKVVTSVMLPQWLESYNKNYISLISGLKLDANEAEMERFRKITKVALKEIFKRGETGQFLQCLTLEENEENEFRRCIPFDQLTVESSLYWCSLVEFLHNEMADEIELIVPELSTLCKYVSEYAGSEKFGGEEDKWKKMEHQYILLTLVEIMFTLDLGDEIGRENLKKLIENLLINFELESQTVQVIVKCTENLIEQQEDRLQFFVDIIKKISDSSVLKSNDFLIDRTLIESLLEKHPDKNLKLKLSSLRLKILDLEEQERNFVEKKDYAKAQEIADEKALCNEEYMNLLKPLLAQDSTLSSPEERRNLSLVMQTKKNTKEDTIKCLQIAFHMVVSKNVRSLTPIACELYKEFIRRHIESNHIVIRNWALKCGTAYSMLYDQLAKDVYNELYAQFFKNQNINIWNTSIDCLFELVDRYGFVKFENVDKQNKNKKPGRQLYNTLELLDVEDGHVPMPGRDVDVVFMMSHILDTCDHISIITAIVNGLCRLVLHGHIKNDDIIEKLLIKYFNPVTETEVNQILGVFFDNLIQRKKQEYLQPCLLPTIQTILSAPYDSPLHEIKPETIIRFVIESTHPKCCSPSLNIHHTIALSFMQEMQNNIDNKDLAKLLSKELITLELSIDDDLPLKNDLKSCCKKLLKCDFEPKTASYIVDFINYLDGKSKNSLGIQETDTNILSDTEETIERTEETVGDPVATVNSMTPVITEEINESAVEQPNESEQPEQSKQPEKPELPEQPEQSKQAEQPEQLEQSKQAEQPELPEQLEQSQQSEPTNSARNSIRNSAVYNSTVINITSLPVLLETDTSTPKKPSNENNVNGEPPKSTTPTTFGKNNTTDVRYLRKSLNARQISTDGPSRPAKIRIEARIQAGVKGIEEISADSNDETQDEPCLNNTDTNTEINASKNKSAAPNKQKELAKDSSDSDELCSPLVVSDDEIVTPRKSKTPNRSPPTKSKDKNTTELNDTNKSEVIPASPEIVPTTRSKRKSKNRKEKKSQATQEPVKITTRKSLQHNKQMVEKTSKRCQSMSPVKSTKEKGDQPVKPSESTTKPVAIESQKLKKNNKNILMEPSQEKLPPPPPSPSNQQKTRRKTIPENTENKTPERNQQKPHKKSNNNKNNTPTNNKTSQQQFQSITVTKSVEKRIQSSTNPVVRIEKRDLNNIETRSASKQKFKLTNIMTRKRLDSIPMMVANLPASSQATSKTQSNQHPQANIPPRKITQKTSKLPISSNMLKQKQIKTLTVNNSNNADEIDIRRSSRVSTKNVIEINKPRANSKESQVAKKSVGRPAKTKVPEVSNKSQPKATTTSSTQGQSKQNTKTINTNPNNTKKPHLNTRNSRKKT